MKILSFFKKKKVEEVKEEIKSPIKTKVEFYYDNVLNVLHLDGIEYKFTIESEERLQNFEKDKILKLYQIEKGINIFRTRMFNTLLNFDRQVIKFFLLVSQEKYNKVVINDFVKYFDNLLKENKELEMSLVVFIHEMYSQYVGGKNFQKELERRRIILKEKMFQEICLSTLNLQKYMKGTVNVELEQKLKDFTSLVISKFPQILKHTKKI